MNLYFWLFSLCAVLSAPVKIDVSICMKHGVRYGVRLQMAGLPVMKKKTEEDDTEKVDSAQMTKGLFSLDRQLMAALLRGGYVKQAVSALQLERLSIHARLSFEDAALTAVSYAAVRTVLHAALLCWHHPEVIQGRVEMDFQQKGSEAFVRCIFSARLGSILAAALRLFAAILRIRARLMTEEETYAATSH